MFEETKPTPHQADYTAQRQQIMDRVVDAMVVERGLDISSAERIALRDAVEVSYQTIFKASWASKARRPRGVVERLLAELLDLEMEHRPPTLATCGQAKRGPSEPSIAQRSVLLGKAVGGHAEIKQLLC